MATVRLVFDAEGARQGADVYVASADRVDQAAQRVARSLKRVEQQQQRVARAQASVGGQTQVQAAQQQAAGIDRVTQAQQRQARSARVVSIETARQTRELAQAQRRVESLRSSFGGAERAAVQFARGQRTIDDALRRGAIADSEAARLRQRLAANTTEAAVRSRDLRVVLGDLAAQSGATATPMGRLATSIGSVSRALGPAGLAGALAGIVTVGGLVALGRVANQTARDLDELIKQADALGASLGGLQRLQFVGVRTGIGDIDRNLEAFSRRIGEAIDGTGEAKQALESLGVSARELAGLDLEEQLGIVADAFQRIDDPARRSAIAADLFSRAGLDMVRVLALGSEGIDDLSRRAEELGLVLDEDAARQAERVRDRFAEFELVSERLRQRLGAELLPVLETVGEALVLVASAAGRAFAAFQDADDPQQLQIAALDARRRQIDAQIDALREASTGGRGAPPTFFGALFSGGAEATQQARALRDLERERLEVLKQIDVLQQETTNTRRNAVSLEERSTEASERDLEATRRGLELVQRLRREAFEEELREREQLARQIEQDTVRGRRLAERLQREAIEEERRAAQQRAEALQRPFTNALENIQREIGDVFTEIYRHGVSTFEDLEDAAKDIFARLAGELTTLALTRSVQGLAGSVLSGLGSGAAIPASQQVAGPTPTERAALEQQSEQTGLLQQILGVLGGSGGGGGGSAAGGGILGRLGGIGTALGLGAFSGSLISGGLDRGLNTEGGINRFSAGIGAGIGLAAYGGALAGAVLTGSTLGSIVPVLGTLVGAVLGLAVGAVINAFSSGPQSGVAQLVTSADPSDPRFSVYNNELLSAEGPFGFIGLNAANKQSLPDNAQLVGAIADFDRGVASLLSRRQVEIVTNALQTIEATPIEADRFNTGDFGRLLADRANVILGSLLDASTLPITDPIRGDNGILERIFQRDTNPQAVAENLEQAIQNLRTLEDGLAALSGNEPTQAARNLRELDEAFRQLAPLAAQFGVELSTLEDALEQGQAALRSDFLAQFEVAILEMSDPLAAALQRLEEERQQQLAEAADLGVETVLLERFYALERQRIIEEFADRANSALQSLFDQLTGSTSSPLPASQALANAQQRFIEDLAAAQGGDLEARDSLAQAARDLLDIRESIFGATEAFFTGEFGFNAVTAQIEALLGTLPTAVSDAVIDLATGGAGGTNGPGGETVVTGAVEIPGVSTALLQEEQTDVLERLERRLDAVVEELRATRRDNEELRSLLNRALAAA